MSAIETIDRPVRFEGTEEQRKANYATHDFVYYGEEAECMNCICKPWHVAASYPCGTEPERETIIFMADGSSLAEHLQAEVMESVMKDFNDAEREDH